MKKKGLIDRVGRGIERRLNRWDRKINGRLKRLDEKLGTVNVNAK